MANKPFSVDYVISTTLRHMRKNVDTSINKTFSRIAEFQGDSKKSTEVLTALSILHGMKAQIDEIQQNIGTQNDN